MNKLGAFLVLLLLFTFTLPVKATHIAGAELNYQCLGNNNYLVTLKMYRDCLNGAAGFDSPITLFIFDHDTGSLDTTIDINFNFQPTPVVPANWNACVGTPYNLCVEEGVYTDTINLPLIPEGYDIAWARCCRNGAITNLNDPLCEGVSFLAHVPGSNDVSTCNTMPAFNQTPPLFLCRGRELNFDYSAVDPDGDSLAYRISNPYNGFNFQNIGAGNPNNFNCGTNANPAVNLGNPMGPPPYQNVAFAPGHTFTNPFGQGFITIDPITGWLTLQPDNLGIYVVAISVLEYRNGVLLSENKRDFQFHVINCIQQGVTPAINRNLGGLPTFNDTVYAQAGRPFCYDFVVTDTASPNNPLLVEGISVSFGGNGGFPPPYATLTTSGSNPVNGQICWEPFCFWIGRTVPMIITARDSLDCPNYNIAFDTVFVRILPSPDAPPVVQPDLAQFPMVNGDTIFTNVDTQFCFNYWVIDTLGGAFLDERVTIKDLQSNVINSNLTTSSVRSGDTLYVEVCWEANCNWGDKFLLELTGIDEYQCPPMNESSDSIWYRILPPPNPPPQFTYDLSTVTFNQDTIYAQVHEQFCFAYLVEDTSLIGDSLLFQYELEEMPTGGFSGPQPFATGQLSLPQLAGDFCWQPACVHVDKTYRLIVEGLQENKCEIYANTPDTLYVRVFDPLNPPPTVEHDLSQAPAIQNNEVILNDDEGFCYTFEMSDSLTPTFLEVSAEVQLAGGLPYSGPPAILTMGVVTDSFLTGQVCFDVTCDYADQSFWIILTGTDTFDCAPGNIIYDTVFVNHTENPPAPVTFCGVSVEPGDVSVSMNWQPNTDSDLGGYRIYRRRDDENTFSLIADLNNPQDTSYLDNSGVEADAHSYCYTIVAKDRCDLESEEVDEHCTILLQVDATPDEYQSSLNWTPYMDWPNGVRTYGIYSSDLNDLTQFIQIDLLDPNTFAYRHTEIEQAIYCYRIRAEEENPGCGFESWSNEECVTFPPRLYFPTGFTPNGDGLNDNFVIPGVFLEKFEMIIFNRWGRVIYTTNDQATGWPGTHKGKPVQEGAYIFQVTGVGYDGFEINRTGTVTLIR